MGANPRTDSSSEVQPPRRGCHIRAVKVKIGRSHCPSGVAVSVAGAGLSPDSPRPARHGPEPAARSPPTRRASAPCSGGTLRLIVAGTRHRGARGRHDPRAAQAPALPLPRGERRGPQRGRWLNPSTRLRRRTLLFERAQPGTALRDG